MSFFEDRLSQLTACSQFIGARAGPVTRQHDYVDGGIAFNDTTQGLMFQTWQARVYYDKILVSADTVPEFLFLEGEDLQEVSMCFDQNMQPCVAYVEQNRSKLRWYNTLTAQFDTIDLPYGTKTPRVVLDDPRPSQSENSDIILVYVRNNALYFRKQRDRFLIEYLLQDGVNFDIVKIGMTSANRLQIQYRDNALTEFPAGIHFDWNSSVFSFSNGCMEINFEDSVSCGGTNSSLQQGVAVGRVLESGVLYMTVSGNVERHDGNRDLLDISVNGRLLVSAASVGEQQGCVMGPAEVTYHYNSDAGHYVEAGDQIRVETSTAGAAYHNNAYYTVCFDLQPAFNAGFIPDYVVLSYEFLSPGRDLDSRIKITSPNIDEYLGWSRASTITQSGQLLAQWSGDNRNDGYESVYFDLTMFRTLYPGATSVEVDCRCFWYSDASPDPITLRMTAYKGGAIELDGYLFANPTATHRRDFVSYRKPISLLTQDSQTIGERLAQVTIPLAGESIILTP